MDLVHFITDQCLITTVWSLCQLAAFPVISIMTSLHKVLNNGKDNEQAYNVVSWTS